MKILHISDLHLGKLVNKVSMLEEQKHALDQIVSYVREKTPDAVLIAGDVYDKPVPPAEAVTLFDDFLTELEGANVCVMVISGNHDSGERLSYLSTMMKKHNIHICGEYGAAREPVTLTDEFGDVDFYLLPFIKTASVKNAYPDMDIHSHTDAVRTAVTKMGIESSRRNVLVAHQFLTGSEKCDSEEINVGGTDNVDITALDVFDYVALGHLHGPQSVAGNDHIRYSGSPLKYSFSEANHTKCALLVELNEKGSPLVINELPLTPIRDMRDIRGALDHVLAMQHSDDYIRVILTDETEHRDAFGRLVKLFPNMMEMRYDNTRTRSTFEFVESEDHTEILPFETFSALFEKQNGKSLSDEQKELLTELIDEIWGAEVSGK